MDRDKAGALTAALCFNWIHFPLHHRQIGTKSPQSHVPPKDLSCNGRLFLHNIFKILLSVLLRKESRSESAQVHQLCWMHVNTEEKLWAWLLARVLGWGSCLCYSCIYFNSPPCPFAPSPSPGGIRVPTARVCREHLQRETLPANPTSKKGLCNK